MKKTYQIFALMPAMLLFSVAVGFSQDTSKLPVKKSLKNKPDTLTAVGSNTGNQPTDKPHAVVKPNSGTAIPSTTSGTLGSSVNPNTQFVIPLHKSKKRSNSEITPDSGIIVPKK